MAGTDALRSPREGCPASFVVTAPSRADAENEDAGRLETDRPGPRRAVLIDGAGLPPALRAGCSHSVAWYAHTLADRLLAALGDLDLSLRHALARAIGEVTALHSATCDLERGGPSATVVAVRARGQHLEHLVLCDSSLLLVGRDGAVHRVTDSRVDDVTARVRTVAGVEALRNAPGGFWVARHEQEAAAQAIVGTTPLAELDRATLVSDGVTRAVDMLALTDEAGLARSTDSADGARALITRIREAEKELDERGAMPARKIHDDATIVTLRTDRT